MTRIVSAALFLAMWLPGPPAAAAPVLPEEEQVVLVAAEGAAYVRRLRDASEGRESWIQFSIPYPFEAQSPVAVTFETVPPGLVGGWRIVRDGLNDHARVTLRGLPKGELVEVAWQVVLLQGEREEFHTFPPDAPIPQAPEGTGRERTWTEETLGVETGDAAIAAAAEGFRDGTDGLLEFISRMNAFLRKKMTCVGGGDQGAAASLQAGQAVCTGYANLVCALYRAADIPARILSCLPNGATLQEHFIVEVEIPGSGWIRHEPTAGVFPYPDPAVSVLRVVTPEDPRSPGNVPIYERSSGDLRMAMGAGVFGDACYHRSRVLREGLLGWEDAEGLRAVAAGAWEEARVRETALPSDVDFWRAEAEPEELAEEASGWFRDAVAGAAGARSEFLSFLGDRQRTRAAKGTLSNGGFEEVAEGKATGWAPTYPFGTEKALEFASDTEVRHGGAASVRIRSRGGFGYNNWCQMVDSFRPGQKYLLRGFVRTRKVQGHAALAVLCWDPQKAPQDSTLLFGEAEPCLSGDTEWTEVNLEFMVPSEAGGIIVRCALQGTGAAWFDDVELTLMEE